MTKRATDLETMLKSQQLRIERFISEQEVELKNALTNVENVKPRLQALEAKANDLYDRLTKELKAADNIIVRLQSKPGWGAHACTHIRAETDE